MGKVAKVGVAILIGAGVGMMILYLTRNSKTSVSYVPYSKPKVVTKPKPTNPLIPVTGGGTGG